MSISSGLVSNCSGVLHPRKSLFQSQSCKTRLNGCNSVRTVTRKIDSGGSQFNNAAHCGILHAAASSGGNNVQSSFDNDYFQEPFLISSVKELYSDLRSLLMFLIEQPGQLKYIEWPGFQSTLKTAALTLGLVAMFIVALSSVDSALAYVLAWFLRKSP